MAQVVKLVERKGGGLGTHLDEAAVHSDGATGTSSGLTPVGRANRIDALPICPSSERLRRAVGHDLAPIDDGDPVGEMLRLVHVMGGEQDRLPKEQSGSRGSPTPRRRAEGSKPVVGSSRNKRSGSPTSPKASSSLRRRPPDNVLIRASASLGGPHEVDQVVGVETPGIHTSVDRQRLPYGELRFHCAFLEDDPDPLLGTHGHPLKD